MTLAWSTEPRLNYTVRQTWDYDCSHENLPSIFLNSRPSLSLKYSVPLVYCLFLSAVCSFAINSKKKVKASSCAYHKVLPHVCRRALTTMKFNTLVKRNPPPPRDIWGNWHWLVSKQRKCPTPCGHCLSTYIRYNITEYLVLLSNTVKTPTPWCKIFVQ